LRTKQGDSLSDCAQFLLTAQCIRMIYSPAKGGIRNKNINYLCFIEVITWRKW